MKLLSGLLTSLLVFGLCAMILRRFSIRIAIAAAVAQAVWMEIQWAGSRANDLSELLVRFSEEIGILVSAIALMAYLLVKRKSQKPEERSVSGE